MRNLIVVENKQARCELITNSKLRKILVEMQNGTNQKRYKQHSSTSAVITSPSDTQPERRRSSEDYGRRLVRECAVFCAEKRRAGSAFESALRVI
jgi:hypothetical protein